MNNKKRFKLYKSGKLWCVAAIAIAIFAMTSMNAHADTNQDSINSTTTLNPTIRQSTLNTDYKAQAVQAPAPQPAHQVYDSDTTSAAYNENGGGASL